MQFQRTSPLHGSDEIWWITLITLLWDKRSAKTTLKFACSEPSCCFAEWFGFQKRSNLWPGRAQHQTERQSSDTLSPALLRTREHDIHPTIVWQESSFAGSKRIKSEQCLERHNSKYTSKIGPNRIYPRIPRHWSHCFWWHWRGQALAPYPGSHRWCRRDSNVSSLRPMANSDPNPDHGWHEAAPAALVDIEISRCEKHCEN